MADSAQAERIERDGVAMTAAHNGGGEMPISYGSVCSGIEAASVAWHHLGWIPRWFAEIEPFPSAVLAHHWPEVSNLGDFTAIRDKVTAGTVEAPDVLVGGTPCQAFSVAGLRQSLDDKRGQLTLEFVRLANAIDTARSLRGECPVTVVWENVPGVLNTPDNAFGCFLAGLVGEDDPLVPPGGRWTNAGYVRGPKRTVAWRILDAQYFGVAQRRRRVFLVASAREGFDPAAVLFESEGLRRDSAPSREMGKDTSPAPSHRAGVGSHWDGGPHPSLNQSHNIGGIGMSNQEIFSQRGACLVPHPVVATFQQSSMAGKGTIGWDESGIAKPCKTQSDGQMIVQGFHGDVAGTQTARHDSSPCADRGLVQVAVMAHGQGGAEIREDSSPTLTCNHEAPIGFVPQAYAIQERAAHPNLNAGPGGKGYQEGVAYTLEARHHVQACAVTGDVFHTLRAEGFDASEDGTGRGCGAVAVGSDSLYIKGINQGEQDASAQEADAREVLHLLREEVGEEAFAEWRSRVLDPLQRPEVLRSPLHGPGLRQAPYEEESAVDDGAPPRPEAVPSIQLRDLWENGPDRRTPQGLRLEEQLCRQSRQALPVVPPQGSPWAQVRRLTPTEAERLQGFPDGHTRIPWRGKPAEECPDGPRYKALGNSMAVPVMRWIGARIARQLEAQA